MYVTLKISTSGYQGVMYSLCNASIYQVFHNKTSSTALLTRFISNTIKTGNSKRHKKYQINKRHNFDIHNTRHKKYQINKRHNFDIHNTRHSF